MRRAILSRSLALLMLTLLPGPASAGTDAQHRGAAGNAEPAALRRAATSEVQFFGEVPPPRLELENLRGKRVSLAKLRGKVVLVNFWATWCKPCVEELPLLAELAERYHRRGLVVVMASIDEEPSRPEIERVAAAMPEGVEVWVGASSDDMARLRLGAAVPVTLILGRDGKVAGQQRGPITRGALDETILELLKREGGSDDDAPMQPEKRRFPGAEQA